jgi:hypothetical protein
MYRTAFFITGFTALLMQVTVIRRLLTVFSGNELEIGITLSVWLSVVGLGSFAGSRIRQHAFSPLSRHRASCPAHGLFISLIRPLFVPTFGKRFAGPFSSTCWR